MGSSARLLRGRDHCADGKSARAALADAESGRESRHSRFQILQLPSLRRRFPRLARSAASVHTLNIILPVGISFVHSMSYTRRVSPERCAPCRVSSMSPPYRFFRKWWRADRPRKAFLQLQSLRKFSDVDVQPRSFFSDRFHQSLHRRCLRPPLTPTSMRRGIRCDERVGCHALRHQIYVFRLHRHGTGRPTARLPAAGRFRFPYFARHRGGW